MAKARFGLRVAGFFDDFPDEKRVRAIDAGVQHRDHRAAAIEPGGPRLIRFDERHTLSENREQHRVVQNAHDVGIEVERGAFLRRHIEGDVGNGLIPPQQAAAPAGSFESIDAACAAMACR